jgi:hypothetical protein
MICPTTGVPTQFCTCIQCQTVCSECKGTGLTTIRGMCGGVEMDCDDQPCPYCERTADQPRESL